jgi:hypothetical protein
MKSPQKRWKTTQAIKYQKAPEPVLVQHCNPNHLQYLPGVEDEYRIQYDDGKGKRILLSEEISRETHRHILEMESTHLHITKHGDTICEYVERGIHYHPGKGHQDHHLQFKIRTERTKELRIKLEFLDGEDYMRCVRGFFGIIRDILLLENDGTHPRIDQFFFTDSAPNVEADKAFLKSKIRSCHIIDHRDQKLSGRQLEDTKQDVYLLPFFD